MRPRRITWPGHCARTDSQDARSSRLSSCSGRLKATRLPPFDSAIEFAPAHAQLLRAHPIMGKSEESLAALAWGIPFDEDQFEPKLLRLATRACCLLCKCFNLFRTWPPCGWPGSSAGRQERSSWRLRKKICANLCPPAVLQFFLASGFSFMSSC